MSIAHNKKVIETTTNSRDKFIGKLKKFEGLNMSKTNRNDVPFMQNHANDSDVLLNSK